MVMTLNGYTMSDADLRRRQEMLDSTRDVVRPRNAAQELRDDNLRRGGGSVARRDALARQDAARAAAIEAAAGRQSTERGQMIESVIGPRAVEDRRSQGLAEVAGINAQSAARQEAIRQAGALRQEEAKPRPFTVLPEGSMALDPVTGEQRATNQRPVEPTRPVSNKLTPMIDATTGKPIPGLFMGPDGKPVRAGSDGSKLPGLDGEEGTVVETKKGNKPNPKETRRMTPDGRMAVYDSETKAFIRYE